MNRQLTRTAATLAVPITMAVTMVFGAGAYAFLTHYSRTLRDSTRGMALGQGEVIRESGDSRPSGTGLVLQRLVFDGGYPLRGIAGVRGLP